jgi:hypothetical protein
MSETIRIAQFGLGPIGLEKDLVELTGIKSLAGRRVYRAAGDLPAQNRPDVALHTTVSKFKDAFDQLASLARLGINVVSSCEELLFPQLKNPELAAQLNLLCQENDARIVGTGVNPGFVMDVLPVCMTGVSREVRSISVQRVVNASTRREPLQRKIGSGLPPEEFRRLFREGRAGHAGLKESLALVAHCMGWQVQEITETGDAVIADHDIRTQFLEVKKGQTCGLHQHAEGKVNGKVALVLDLKMYLDAKNPRDAIKIEGEPPLDVVVNGGVAGDHATVAALVNTARRILNARPGLLLMKDLAVPSWA